MAVDDRTIHLLPHDVCRRISAEAKRLHQHIVFEFDGVNYVAFISGRITDMTRHGGDIPGNVFMIERLAEDKMADDDGI